MKIIQERSLPTPLEICEIKFDVNNEQHDFQVSYIIATKRIFWLCTKIFSNTRHSFKIMNLCVHYFIFMAYNKGGLVSIPQCIAVLDHYIHTISSPAQLAQCSLAVVVNTSQKIYRFWD